MWQKLKKKKKRKSRKGQTLSHHYIYSASYISTSALHLCELLMQQDEQLDENKSESKDKRRWNGKGKKIGGTKCKREETRVSEESCHARGSVPVLNISITDWAAMKMLLIQTPKDFYKTSISLSWLQHSGIHQGSKSKKICVRARKKTFHITWILSKRVILIMMLKPFPPFSITLCKPADIKAQKVKAWNVWLFLCEGKLKGCLTKIKIYFKKNLFQPKLR